MFWKESPPDANKEGRNLQFYRDEIPMKPVGLTVSEFHQKYRGDFGFLESCHSFIQWLFPNRERGLNYQAPILTQEESDEMRKDPAVLARIRTSLDVMLEFYGMSLINLPSGELAVRRNPATWSKCIRNLAWSSHNWLRISRILKFLTDVGMEAEKMAWLRRLRYEVVISKTLSDAINSFSRFWATTIADKADLKEFLEFPNTKEEREEERDYMDRIVGDKAAAVDGGAAAAAESEGDPAKSDAETSSTFSSTSSFASSSSSHSDQKRGVSTARSEVDEDAPGGTSNGPDASE